MLVCFDEEREGNKSMLLGWQRLLYLVDKLPHWLLSILVLRTFPVLMKTNVQSKTYGRALFLRLRFAFEIYCVTYVLYRMHITQTSASKQP